MITESASGDLWIGGYGSLTRLRNGKFTRWTEHDGLPSNNVRAIYGDSDSIVWIGAYDGGLGRFKDGKFVRYTTHDGLLNNGVEQCNEAFGSDRSGSSSKADQPCRYADD